MNPLAGNWLYPKGVTDIRLKTLWLHGKVMESVPPLAKLWSTKVRIFDRNSKTLSKIQTFMGKVEEFCKVEGL